MTRAIPATGEQLPIVGLGSSATLSRVACSEAVTALREVLSTFVDNGASVFDTAPSYGASEEGAGGIASELGISEKIFLVAKVNGGGARRTRPRRGTRSSGPSSASGCPRST